MRTKLNPTFKSFNFHELSQPLPIKQSKPTNVSTIFTPTTITNQTKSTIVNPHKPADQPVHSFYLPTQQVQAQSEQSLLTKPNRSNSYRIDNSFVKMTNKDKKLLDNQSTIFYDVKRERVQSVEPKNEMNFANKSILWSDVHIGRVKTEVNENAVFDHQYAWRRKMEEQQSVNTQREVQYSRPTKELEQLNQPNIDVKKNNQQFSDLFGLEYGHKDKSPMKKQLVPNISWNEFDSSVNTDINVINEGVKAKDFHTGMKSVLDGHQYEPVKVTPMSQTVFDSATHLLLKSKENTNKNTLTSKTSNNLDRKRNYNQQSIVIRGFMHGRRIIRNELLKMDQAYINHLQGCVDMPKVEFPAYFNGLRGVRAREFIPIGEAVIKVHHKAVISAYTVFTNQQCCEIMKNHPQIYPTLGEIKNGKSDFQTLILYVATQRHQNPIFAMTPNPTSLIDFKGNIPYVYLYGVSNEFMELYERQKQKVLSTVGLNGNDYDYAYRYCMNRRLSVSNKYPFSFIVPMVDMINHGSNKVSFNLEDGSHQPEQMIANNPKKLQYVQHRRLFLSQDDQELVNELVVNESERCSKILRKLIKRIHQEQLKSGQMDVWDSRLLGQQDSEEEEVGFYEEENIQQVQAQVDDHYMRDYYEQADESTELDWYNELWEDTPLGDAYLSARALDDIEVNEQVLNCYGCYGNEHLLLYYGFALENNKYDRCRFRIVMDCNSKEEFIKNIEQYVLNGYVSKKEIAEQKYNNMSMNQITSEFKLRKSTLCMQLIEFLRTYLQVLDNTPVVEDIVLSLYGRIVVHLLKHIHSELSSVDDAMLLIYGRCKQSILRSHEEMLGCLNISTCKMSIKIFNRVKCYGLLLK